MATPRLQQFSFGRANACDFIRPGCRIGPAYGLLRYIEIPEEAFRIYFTRIDGPAKANNEITVLVNRRDPFIWLVASEHPGVEVADGEDRIFIASGHRELAELFGLGTSVWKVEYA